jgi:hypothetical protein
VEIVVLFRILQVSDPILVRFRAALADAFGERIERVVLFGSRTRGEAGPDSDYDVAVFLKDFAGVVEEMGADRQNRDRHPDGRRRRDQRASPAGRRIP